MFLPVLRREIVSTTSDESMIDPSTIASGERCSIPSLTSWNVPPFFSFSSTSFTAEEPISSPTTFLLFEKNTTHPVHLTHSLLRLAPDVESRLKLQPLKVSVNSTAFRFISRLREHEAVSVPVVASNRSGRYNPAPWRYLRFEESIDGKDVRSLR